MIRRRWAAALSGALVVVAACGPGRASRTVVVDPWPALRAAADADAVEGCYRCLERALTTYESGLGRAEVGVGPSAYRTAVHLAIRERLLGLYPGAYQTAPARLAPRGAPGGVAVAEDVGPAVAWRRGTLGTETDAWAATLLLAMVGTHPVIGLDEGQALPRGMQPGLDRDTWWRCHPDDGALSLTRLTLLRGSLDDLTAFRIDHSSFDEVGVILGDAEPMPAPPRPRATAPTRRWRPAGQPARPRSACGRSSRCDVPLGYGRIAGAAAGFGGAAVKSGAGSPKMW